MTSITRIDAIFTDTTGERHAVSLFTATDVYRQEKLAQFYRYGWEVSEQPIDERTLTRQEKGGLIGPVWPPLELSEILQLIREPIDPRASDVRFEPKSEFLKGDQA